ncbi:MAG: DsbA family protein [Rhodospirillales bacterium]|nr:DsbA family protein [Rhodospirillales bacterium]
MQRRALIASAAAVVVVGAAGGVAWYSRRSSRPVGTPPAPALPAALPPTDPKMTPRAIGQADAPVTVMEFFSLTCPHCARFSGTTLQQVKKDLVATGKVRIVFHDFPLDNLALLAAMVARTLPADKYEPFCEALFASQDTWAFARNVDNIAELGKIAALWGMPNDQFRAAIADTPLKVALLNRQDNDQKRYSIDSTPSFVFNGPGAKNVKLVGEMPYSDFAGAVAKAAA